MKEEILERIKMDYEKMKSEKEQYQKVRKRIQELEENELIKEYLGLLSQTESYDYERIAGLSKEKMYDRAFRNHLTSIKETNGIYVYLGTFIYSIECDIEHGANDYRVNRNNPNADYRLYQDIESYDSIEIPIKKCEDFEKTHQVIFAKTYPKNLKYYEIQNYFIKTSIEEGQEVACKKLLKKYK